MASFYESATSGLNFDRFVEEADDTFQSPSSEAPAINEVSKRVKQKYWTAKEIFRTKVLGAKRDEHQSESDKLYSEKTAAFSQICSSTRELMTCIDDLHRVNMELRDCEGDVAFLNSQSTSECEKDHLAGVMKLFSTALGVASKERQKLLGPLVDFYQELESLSERAIADCCSTVEAAEKVRLDYKGSLLWIKDASGELDPSNEGQMEKFRGVQRVVRANKDKFEQLKEDTLHKVDVLSEARASILRESLLSYSRAMLDFYENVSTDCYEPLLSGGALNSLGTYEIDVLKILNDPVGQALQKDRLSRASRGKTITSAAKAEESEGKELQQGVEPGENAGKEFNFLSLDDDEDKGGGNDGKVSEKGPRSVDVDTDNLIRLIEMMGEEESTTNDATKAGTSKVAPSSAEGNSTRTQSSLLKELWELEGEELKIETKDTASAENALFM